MLRHGVALLAGLLVVAALGSAAGAQQCIQPSYPLCYQLTVVAAGQQGAPSPTTTATVAAAAAVPTATHTATIAAVAPGKPASQASAAPANAAVILGGRGRVANVRATSFTVLWSTDTDTTGQILYGSAATLGSTVQDVRGGVSSSTHYVDVTGLQPNTNYFFDVQSGSAIDNNQGQHYQIKTGPEIGAPPSNNAVVGSVLNPGGTSPAAGALVWATVRDGNTQGTSGASQLLAVLAGQDGRFRLGMQPRVPDFTTYFQYSNEGDLIDLFGRAASGEVSGTIDTRVTQEGGTAPAEARMVLMQVTPTAVPAGAASATPTLTVVPTVTVPAVAKPAAAATETLTPAAAAAPTQPTLATPTVAGVPAPPTSVPVPTRPGAVQLPPLKEMLLNQLGFGAAQAQPAPTPPAKAQPGVDPAAKPPPAGQPPYPLPAQPAAAVPLTATPTFSAVPGPGVVVPGPAIGNPQLGPGVAPTSANPGVTQPLAVPTKPAPAAPIRAVPVPTPPPSGLSTMPAPVSLLFYGGLALVALGAGVAAYSLLNGPDWRPR